MKRLWLFALALCIVPSMPTFCQDAPQQDTYNGDPLCKNIRGSHPRATYAPAPPYDEKDRRAKIEGVVGLSLIVTKEGRPVNPVVTKSLTPGLDQQAVKTVLQWKFEPAMQDGKPCPMKIAVEAQFKLY